MMKLKETVFKICDEIKSEYSTETLSSFVLFEISQHEHFKDIYSHFSFIKKNNEVRILSAPLNNISGLFNGKHVSEIINPHYDQSDKIFQLNDDDDFSYENNFTEENDYKIEKLNIYINNDRLHNIHSFFNILENSNNFNDAIQKIKLEKNLLLDVNQYILGTQSIELKELVKPIIDIISNLHEYSNENSFFKIENKRISFGYTNARDYFKCNALSYLANQNDESVIENILNKSSLKDIENLFLDENTGYVPYEIRMILDDTEQDNALAFKLFTSKDNNYRSKIIDVIAKDTNKEEKHYDIANLFFDELKTKAMKAKNEITDKIRPLDEIKNNQKLVDVVVNMVLDNYPVFSKEIKNTTVFKHYDIKENSYETEQTNDLMKINDLLFYDNNYTDHATKGLQYVGEDFFSYSKQKENFCIKIYNENELLSFGSFYEEEGVLRINNVNTAKHHTGKGLIKQVYNELIKYAIKNNLAIETSMYSEKGQEILPSLKRKLLEENKQLLWLDTCYNNQQTKAETLMSTINKKFLENIHKNNDFKSLPKIFIRKIYDKELKILNNKFENELSFYDEYSISENLAEKMTKLVHAQNIKYKTKKNNKTKFK